MDKMSAEYSPEAPSPCSDFDSPYSSARIIDAVPEKPQAKSRLYRGASATPWSAAPRQIPKGRAGSTAFSVHRMSELVKRIEDSAESSSAWERIGGRELSLLRMNFGELLGRILEELDPDAGELRERYEIARTEHQNGDILYAYRFACLLSSAIAGWHGQGTATRIEVACYSKNTEFACFLGDHSAGVTMRKNDNLFALCTNGRWNTEPLRDAPLLATLRRVIQSHGGQLCIDGLSVKASFPVSI